MYYKIDWAEAKKRFDAFWHREVLDRCCIAVSAPRQGAPLTPPEPPPRTQEELRRNWLDPEINLRRMLASFERTFYGGEAFPATTMCLGASVMAAFYGSPAEFRTDTVWYHPIIKDLPSFTWRFTPEADLLYRATIENTRYFAEHCRGRYLVGLPELGSATDDLSLLRGMEPLFYDMLDCPDAVKRGISQAAGKCLILPFVLFDEVESLLAQLSARGLHLVTSAPNEDAARDLLHHVTRWTRD